MVSRAAAAMVAFAVPSSALAGAWTEREGRGLLIETVHGWLGDGLPFGGRGCRFSYVALANKLTYLRETT
jgi:hypothetical protein